jgi:hypothetical protein
MNTFTLGLIVVAYLLSLAYLGFLGYKKTTNTSDYLVGGRQMNPIVMALSYGATFISASAIVGFGGVAAAFGMGIQWLCFLNSRCRNKRSTIRKCHYDRIHLTSAYQIVTGIRCFLISQKAEVGQ